MTIFTLVIPTFNEAENICILIPRIISLLTAAKISFEIIVVDDDSKDLTWKAVQEKFSNESRVHVLRRVNKKGLSSAVLDGMALAKGKYMGVMDADLQHDENIIPKMISELENHDIVVGSRVVGDGGYGEWGVIRKTMSKGATLLAKIMLPIPVGDPMSGFFVLRRELYEELVPVINPRGFKILLEFLARKKGIKAKEVGFVFKTRIHGETKMSGSVIQNYLVALYDIRFGNFISLTFLKYGLTGLTGVFVNLFGQFLAMSFLHPGNAQGYYDNFTKPFIAVAFGFEISVLSNYIINNLWTFSESKIAGFKANIKGFIKFNLVSITGFIVQISVWRFTYQIIQDVFPQFLFPELTYLCNFAGIVLATAGNYFLNKNFTWKEKNS
ncbi:MAG: glycosyltransferase family 2 protein [Leptospiraceae bacterium]|nr:glycosyltransferase family 2 protein [Leptospiraceae bacterium]